LWRLTDASTLSITTSTLAGLHTRATAPTQFTRIHTDENSRVSSPALLPGVGTPVTYRITEPVEGVQSEENRAILRRYYEYSETMGPRHAAAQIAREEGWPVGNARERINGLKGNRKPMNNKRWMR
jgi:hypothetical protein